MLQIGQKAPRFTMDAVIGKGDFVTVSSDKLEGKWKVLYFYPLDFTFVCPSELIALDRRLEEFAARGTEVVTVSIDSHFTHNAYRKTPISDGGIGEVKFTMVADMNHRICQAYGVEHPEAGVALRGVFIIDNHGVVRAQLVNDLPIGRNVDELLRLIDAVQFTEKHGEVCPAGWKKGDAGMNASPEGVAEYLAEHSSSL